MAPPLILVGPRVVLYLNGQAFGRVSSFQWSSATAMKAIYALDNSFPYELMPTQTKVTGTIGLYRLAGDGGAEAAGMTTTFDAINRQKYFTLSLVQRDTGATIFQANYCVLQIQSWNAPARSFVTGSLSFEALFWNNEAPEPPA
jgi:hypothetical protein